MQNTGSRRRSQGQQGSLRGEKAGVARGARRDAARVGVASVDAARDVMRRGAHKFHGYADEVLERLLAFASSTVAEQLAEQTDAGARRTDGAVALAFALAHCLCVERRVIDQTLSAGLPTHAAITQSIVLKRKATRQS